MRDALPWTNHKFLKCNLVVSMKCGPMSVPRQMEFYDHDQTQTSWRCRSSLFRALRARNGQARDLQPSPFLSENLLPEQGSGKSLQRAVRLPGMDCLAS